MTNEEATAYAVLALQRSGVPLEDIGRVVNDMESCFDRYSEAEAVVMASLVRDSADKALMKLRRRRA